MKMLKVGDYVRYTDEAVNEAFTPEAAYRLSLRRGIVDKLSEHGVFAFVHWPCHGLWCWEFLKDIQELDHYQRLLNPNPSISEFMEALGEWSV